MRQVTAGWVRSCALALLCGLPARSAVPHDFHDFDFAFGDWRARIVHLQRSPGKADEWAVWTGRVVATKIWGGRANIQQIEVNTPSGPSEELRLCLYRPLLRQWYLYWADSDDGVLAKPMIGRFAGDSGRFYDQEDYKGRAIFVRDLYSQITPRSYHWQQAFSSDGGGTWEPNWNVVLTLDSSLPASTREIRQSSAATDSPAHAFDFARGEWRTTVLFLSNPSAASPRWTKIRGRVTVHELWSGAADLEETEANGAHELFEALTLRLYDPTARQWYLYRASSDDGVLGEPLIGDFKDGRGVFYDQDTRAGHTVFVRNVYFDVTANAYRFEQALSNDGGKTWQTDLTAQLRRVAD
jgi:hypothetical protein